MTSPLSPDLNLEINEGEFFTLLGPSGSGKTTALRTLAGFNIPAAGTVNLNGRDITRELPEKRGIGWCSRTTRSIRR